MPRQFSIPMSKRPQVAFNRGGQISGIEAAVHAIRSTIAMDENEAVLLVDASNAFNSLNRQAALYNISRVCQPLSTILPTLTYQGDPPMYALATIPLIKELDGEICDAATVGKITDLGQTSCPWPKV